MLNQRTELSFDVQTLRVFETSGVSTSRACEEKLWG